MIKFIRYLIILILFSIPVNHFTTADAADDAIIAVVNDELITLQDLNHYSATTYASLAARGLDEQTLQQVRIDLEINGLNKLIEDKLMLSAANKIGLSVNEKVINDRIEEVKKNYESEEAFTNALILNGATLTDLRNKILEDFKIKFVIDHEVRSKIYVNPQEVTDFYEKNIDKFKTPERVQLDSIFIAFSKNPQDARDKANEAMQAIQKGADFLEINKQYSKTPSIGVLERGQILSAVEDIVFNLKDGELSPIIELDSGLYIFRVNTHVPGNIATLDDVKKDITQILFETKFRENFKKWIDKLKSQAYVEIKKN